MKKVLSALLILSFIIVSIFSFSACTGKASVKTVAITIAVPDGGPALGMAYLMKNYEKIGETSVTYKIVDGANGIKAAVMSGEADIAILPSNMAAILYNNKIDIKLVGTNSYGLLYMLSNVVSAESFTLDSLKGEVLNLLGQGGTPEIVVKKVLDAAGIAYDESDVAIPNKVALKFHADGKTIIGGLKQKTIRFAVLGEPAVSTALQQVGSPLGIVLNLQDAWKTAAGTSASYPQTALVAKSSLIKTDAELVKKVAKLTFDNSLKLNQDAQPLIDCLREKGATVPATFGTEGVQRTNITPKFGARAKADLVAYFTILKDYKAQLIGGKLPADDFYMEGADLETYQGDE